MIKVLDDGNSYKLVSAEDRSVWEKKFDTTYIAPYFVTNRVRITDLILIFHTYH